MNLKILLINDKLHAGGAELALQNLSACLTARGHSLTLWGAAGRQRTSFPEISALRKIPPPSLLGRALPAFFPPMVFLPQLPPAL